MSTYFHLYGFLIGLAAVVGLLLVEYKYRAELGNRWNAQVEYHFWSLVTVTLLGGLIGARIWHVMTDWPLYQDSLVNVVKIWQGGLSILGAIVGGVAGLWVGWKKMPGPGRPSLLTLLDLVVFGLPFAQAIGRLGNYVNQELYGAPTDLPWGMEINGVSYHPLWAYEAVLMIFFGMGIWLYEFQHNQSSRRLDIGSGQYFLSYLFYYCLIRFGLDFLRLEKAIGPVLGLGINQTVLLITLCIIIAVKSWSVCQPTIQK